jgi:hypothetical protein
MAAACNEVRGHPHCRTARDKGGATRLNSFHGLLRPGDAVCAIPRSGKSCPLFDSTQGRLWSTREDHTVVYNFFDPNFFDACPEAVDDLAQ